MSLANKYAASWSWSWIRSQVWSWMKLDSEGLAPVLQDVRVVYTFTRNLNPHFHFHINNHFHPMATFLSSLTLTRWPTFNFFIHDHFHFPHFYFYDQIWIITFMINFTLEPTGRMWKASSFQGKNFGSPGSALAEPHRSWDICR